MEKIAIAICGSAGVDYVTKDHGMRVFRSKISINGVEYVDYVDISTEQFYFLLKDAKELHTAQISTGELINLIKDYRNEGYTDLIMITLSSGLSGTYQNVRLAAMDIENINVHVFDSLFVGFPSANLGLVGMELIKKGYSAKEIVEKLTYIRDNSYLCFTVETLEYLRLNGRLSNASAFVGNLLKIKPILHFNDLGQVVVKEKIRTKSKAVSTMIDSVLEDIKGKNVTPFLMYSDNFEELCEIREVIKEKAPELGELAIYNIPPVIGVHCGPGTVGIGYIPNID